MRLVYLSPVPWSSIAQRPHFFVKEAMRNGFSSVLWIEPTPSRLPQFKDIRNKLLTSVEADSFNKPDGVEIFKPKCIPIEPLGPIYDWVNKKAISETLKYINNYIISDDKTVLVIGKPSRFALDIISGATFHKIVFDVMDDFPKFFSGLSAISMEKLHRRVIKKADKCFFSSTNLQDKYGILAKQSELVLNACDEEFKNQCQSISKENNRVHNVTTFGYVGSIAEWFDWDSVIKLAQDNPKDKIIIVGPNYSKSIPILPSNIELRKAVQHSEIPKLLASFDFGLIPFKINELTNSVDPIKYYEYIASGLGVITTVFGEMAFRVSNGSAVSFSQFQEGLRPNLDNTVTWKERFNNKNVVGALLNVKEY